jgi:hypothetical protein
MPEVLAGLEKTMSPVRLARFTPPGGDKNYGLRIGVWNARLCQEFYIPIQFAEIAFRNGIHRRLQSAYGNDWHTNPRMAATLPQRHRTELADVAQAERVRLSG